MINRATRTRLLCASAIGALAACSGGGNVASTGGTGPVTVVTGGTTGGGAAALDYTATACPVEAPERTVRRDGVDLTVCVVPGGTLTADLTIGGGNAYALDGSLFVGENAITTDGARSATLTIEPGTVVFGLNGEDAVFVQPGSRIEARGTPSQPIVMTSASDLADGNAGDSALRAASDGTSNGRTDARGQWGGLVISGLAPINDCADTGATPGTAACVKDGEGGSGLFGGDDEDDDSGTLEYVRVQYAGFRFSTDDELNGIAFQGVGSGTDVSFVQVHNNQDDGVEFFGGTVSADHVVVTGAGDDSIDWTDGWTGELQYAVVVHANGAADRAIEGDNRSDDNDVGADQGRRSDPIIANATFIGADGIGSDGIKLRAGTDASIYNSIVVGFQGGEGLDFDADGEATPEVFSLFVANNASPFDDDAEPIFNADGANNVASAGNTLDGLFSGEAEQDVAATEIDDRDLDDTDYVGAFADDVQAISDSWLADWTLTQALGVQAAPECPAGTNASTTPIPSGRTETNVCTLPSVVASDLRLTRGNLYELDGAVFVGTDLGGDVRAPANNGVSATLTVDSGVTLFGLAGEDALIVTRGSRLAVNGTRAAPVVMTALADLNGQATGASRGLWGGVVINGRAPINACADNNLRTTNPADADDPDRLARCQKDGEGGSGFFGGNDPEDDSGNLNFLQVRYAGFRFSTDDELNGIAFQGVGRGTEVDFVQVHNNADDGVEFFGGTVNARHLVLTGNGDDSIDWTDGWTGAVQYAVVVHENGDGDNGIEGDNRSDDTGILPRSNPIVANFTFLSAEESSAHGARLRAGTSGRLFNGVIQGFPEGVDYDDVADDAPRLASVVVGGADEAFVDVPDAAATDTVAVDEADLTAIGTDAALVPVPGGNVAEADAADIDEDDDAATDNAFVEDADYVGAVEDQDDDWFRGWTFRL